jgi:DNA-binding transcriptional LysR family regulator
MARIDAFTGLTEFLAVAAHSSFRAAATQLGTTPSAVSQAIRALELRLGLPLFQRTTRRVGLTEAGATLLARLKPAANEIGDCLEALGALRERPSGLLRLSVPRIAVELVVVPLLPAFRQAFPEVAVEVDVNDAAIDLAAEGFDAGIRIGEFVQRDMVALPVTPDIRWMVLGSPAYFAARGWPQRPEDLIDHECLRYRFPTARSVYRWEFLRDGKEFSIDVPGKMLLNDSMLFHAMACQGLGLIYTTDAAAERELAEGRLVAVLEAYLPTSPGLYLYFPRRSQAQPKLRAFIDVAMALAKSRPAGPAREIAAP